MFYRKTTLIRARVHTIFTDGGCGCGCGGTDRRGASVSIGPNHSTHLCPPPLPPVRPSLLLLLSARPPRYAVAVPSPPPRPTIPVATIPLSSQRRTTLLSYPTLSYPVLSDGGHYQHQLHFVTSVETHTVTFWHHARRTLTHCTTWWRAHLSLPLINVRACTHVYPCTRRNNKMSSCVRVD